MARTKSRGRAETNGTRHGVLHRATGTPRGQKVPKRLVRAAAKGRYGRAAQSRAKSSRGGSR